MRQAHVLLCYSPADEDWKDRLVRQLEGPARDGRINLWDASRIRPGEERVRRIEEAIDAACVAVLLVSADFLASEAIRDEQLPHLLERQREAGLCVVPVIVRPCLWGTVDWLSSIEVRPRDRKALALGDASQIEADLAALARDILDLAADVKGDRWEPWTLTEMGRPPPPWGDRGRFRLEPESILPYLCDRSTQEAELKVALAEHRRERPRRPLVLLIHGHYHEAHEMFVGKLRVRTLPQLLGLDEETQLIRHKGPLFFTDPRRGAIPARLDTLRREVATLLCEKEDADLDEMADAVARLRSPVMVEVAFNVNQQNPSPDPKLLRAWFDTLAQWRDLPHGQPLIFILRFSWKESKKTASPLLFWKKTEGERVARIVDQLVAAADDRLSVVALPRLESVGEDEVISWVEEHAVPAIREAKGAGDPVELGERLRELAHVLFTGSGCDRLPMDQLGPKLRTHLRECLKEGGI